MALRIWARVSLAALLISSPAAAQKPAAVLPLPALATCHAASHPRLPEKSRATFLIAPFTQAQLVLSEIVYDASFSAMRVKLYGVKGGSVDLLVPGHDTFVLVADGGAIKQCRHLGDTGWRPLPQDWLTGRSQCAASAPIGESVVDWWKTAIEPAPASYWIWYRQSDGWPFRLVFPFPNN